MKKGDKGQEVKTLQMKLNKILDISLVIDGDFGPKTEKAVNLFQACTTRITTGIVSDFLLHEIDSKYTELIGENNLMSFGKRRKVIFVGAGHGGWDGKKYVTPGKRAYHQGEQMHDEKGNYYEGYENRLMAEEFIEQCTAAGIATIRVYHPWQDTSLSERTELVRSYLNRGYYGGFIDFHTNAINETNSKEDLEDTQGFIIFSTRANNSSDDFAKLAFKKVAKNLPDLEMRTDKKNKSVCFSANFQVLRETDLDKFPDFWAVLVERNFHTSAAGCKQIIVSRNEMARSFIEAIQDFK